MSLILLHRKTRIVNRTVRAIVLSVCLLAAILTIASCASNTQADISRVLDFGTVMKGVHVAGIDLSGMTRAQALAATAHIPAGILDSISFTVDAGEEAMSFSAEELGVDTDYEDVIEYAFTYGHKGTHDQRSRDAYAAANGLVNFTVNARAAEKKVKSAAAALKERLDKLPRDAGYVFMPSGYLADGTPCDPGSGGDRIRIAEGEMPNPLRYQYYLTNRYVNNYIPAEAGVSRFQYTPEQSGRSTDIDALAASVINAVNNKDYSAVTVPVTTLEPSVKSADIARQTQLLSSWTSSYSSHDGADRNYNVAKLSALINGVVIAPGETWSINEHAGPRTYEKGWKGAPGISDGAFVTAPGGGVCQVSSTLYNAALRAGLDITESSRHSIISNYMPVGLDATISTGNKDLKLYNPYDTPVFIISYVNANDKNVTVEIYGPPVVLKAYGEVILDFSSEITESTEMPQTKVHYRAAETPDGKRIAPGASRTYIKARRGTTAQVYIHYISLDGKELEVKKFYVAKYPKIEGEKYVNDVPSD